MFKIINSTNYVINLFNINQRLLLKYFKSYMHFFLIYRIFHEKMMQNFLPVCINPPAFVIAGNYVFAHLKTTEVNLSPRLIIIWRPDSHGFSCPTDFIKTFQGLIFLKIKYEHIFENNLE